MDKEVWILNNDEMWRLGVLVEKNNEKCRVKVNDEYYDVDKDSIMPKAYEDLTTVEDLIRLSHLHEPSILDTLVKKYNIDRIYTNTGPVLIAINPFHNLDIYNDKQLEKYNQKLLPEESHVYLVAASALKDMRDFNRSQTILASGESGSGKTVTTKHLLHFLTWESNNTSSLENKILESTPLMESFGNAKTIRNDNSSRFGKFIKVFLNDDGDIQGTTIETYLLEKIRVIEQNPGERNFHIFYQLLDSDIAHKYNLKTVEDYDILSNKDNDSIKLVFEKEVKKLDEVIESFKTLNFGLDEIDNILKIIALILNLGNIKVDKEGVIKTEYTDEVCNITGWTLEQLNDFVCHEVIKVGIEQIKKNLTLEKSVLKLHTFMQVLYETLFKWITMKINHELSQKDCSEYKFIGILDIFGFEIFKRNSLEQFHINYTNEYLQQIFNKTIFKKEQEEYQAEKIDWSFVEYIDNIERLNAIHGKESIFTYLDQECIVPKGTDKALLSKLTNLENEYVEFTKLGVPRGEFKFNHYAGEVTYNVNGFCHKNKFHLNDDLFQLISDSNCEFLHEIFRHQSNKVKGKGKSLMKITISSTFKEQLKDLVTTIESTRSHFVRCIKPNDKNRPNDIDIRKVMLQLRYGGITEAVRVVRAGFPVKFTHDYFRERYYALTLDRSIDINDFKEQLDDTDPNHIQVGLSKVFMKQEVYESIEEMKEHKLYKTAIEIQKIIRGSYFRRMYVNLRLSTLTAQRVYRGYMARKFVREIRRNKSAITIQKILRGHKVRYIYQLIRASAKIIRDNWKKYRLNKNIKLLQSYVSHVTTTLNTFRTIYNVRVIQNWYRIRKKELGDKITQLMKQVERAKHEKQLELERIEREKEEEIKRIKEDEERRREEEQAKLLKWIEEERKLQEEKDRKIKEEIEVMRIERERREKELEEEKRLMAEQLAKEKEMLELKMQLEIEKETKAMNDKLEATVKESTENNTNFNNAMKVNRSLTMRIQQVLDEMEELKAEVARQKELRSQPKKKRGLWSLLFGE
jgi:myosin-5